jgi:hypothetical protein
VPPPVPPSSHNFWHGSARNEQIKVTCKACRLPCQLHSDTPVTAVWLTSVPAAGNSTWSLLSMMAQQCKPRPILASQLTDLALELLLFIASVFVGRVQLQSSSALACQVPAAPLSPSEPSHIRASRSQSSDCSECSAASPPIHIGPNPDVLHAPVCKAC